MLRTALISTLLCAIACGPIEGARVAPEPGSAVDGPQEVEPTDSLGPSLPPMERKQTPVTESTAPRIERRCALPELPPEGAISMRTVNTYATLGGVPLGLDTFSLPGSSVRPAVLLIHGGGWRAGERAHVHDMARLLAAEGFVGVAVDYRKTEEEGYRFPGAIGDLRCAVRYLRANAAALRIDPARIGAVGFSAGGQLAALLATAPDISELDDGCPLSEHSPNIQAAVSYYGPYDLTRRGDFVRRARRLIDQLCGGVIPGRARLASPLHHVDPSDPPMLLIHGTTDRVVPISQAERMARRLRRARVPHALLPVHGAGHGFTLLSTQERFMPASCTTLAFLHQRLDTPEEP